MLQKDVVKLENRKGPLIIVAVFYGTVSVFSAYRRTRGLVSARRPAPLARICEASPR